MLFSYGKMEVNLPEALFLLYWLDYWMLSFISNFTDKPNSESGVYYSEFC